MFGFDLCSHKHCNKPVICRSSDPDFYAEDAEHTYSYYCSEHCEDNEKVRLFVTNYILNRNIIAGLSLSGIHLKDCDFTGKRFYGCNFQHCSFMNVQAEGCKIHMSVFDFSVFTDCNMVGSNIQFSSFAGSAFSHAIFTNSELIHNNFNGITAIQSSFDDSDLYNSRFIRSNLLQTSFRNCNIKKPVFTKANKRIFLSDCQTHGKLCSVPKKRRILFIGEYKMKIYFHLNIEGFSNAYLIVNPEEKSALIIDPGKVTIKMIEQIEQEKYTLDAVLITHNHASHTMGLNTLQKIYTPKIYAADYEVAKKRYRCFKG